MTRLFWKLFLSYWAALMLFAAGTLVATSVYLEHSRADHARRDPQRDYFARMQQAQAAADAGGLDGLKNWAKDIDRHDLVPLLVLDHEGQDLLGREVSNRAFVRLQRLLRHEDIRGPRMPRAILADGREFWLLPDFDGVTLRRFVSLPRVMAVPVLLATLAGGLVCLLLAHYLSAPMVRLRKAAQDYASGDFNQRVAPALGSRRDEIVDLAHAMDDMAERLDLMLKSQRALLRDVSHELRSPLARVEAALGLARQRGMVGGELDRIEREVERLNEMIGAILSYSRLQSGMRTPALEPVELDQLLSEVVEDARLEATRRQVTVKADEFSQASCMGDPQLLHSALDNVLRNAVNHAPEGSVIEVSLNPSVKPAASRLYEVRVRDHGAGVPPDMLERIFDPFVRAGSGSGQGIGLGLAIAQRAVRAHRGSIRAENCLDGGLSVIICLPCVSDLGDGG